MVVLVVADPAARRVEALRGGVCFGRGQFEADGAGLKRVVARRVEEQPACATASAILGSTKRSLRTQIGCMETEEKRG